MTYFITVEELKQTTFNANLDDEYIVPALEEAQSIYLREIIGDLLYNSITSKIDSETLSGKYLTLVNQYIKPYLTYKVQSVIVIPLNNKTRNAGIINQYDQGFNTSTMKDTAYLADYYNSRAEFYANRLTTYLQKNATDFPEYGYSDDNITQPNESQNVTTLFLGGGRKKGCGCNTSTPQSTATTVEWDNVQNKPDFAQVAYSNDYNDLDNKPDIPSLEGYATETYVTNAVQQVEGEIPTVPTNVSAFTNDAGYLTQHQSLDGYATETWVQQQGYSTFDGDYNNLTNKPSIPAAPVQSNWNESDSNSLAYIQNKPSIPAAQVNADWDAVSGVAQILNKPTIPAAQVQSDWNEADTSSKAYIANKPTIPTVPTNVSAFTNDAGYTTFDGDYNSLTNKPTIPVVPTNVSAFTNDAGYLTQHQSLDGYATETWVQEQGFSTFSGSYNDLTDKPSIPTVNNAVMTIKQGGVARGTFSANANENVEINLDAGGAAQVQADWNEADSTAVDYIKNKPTIPTVPTNVSAFTNDAGYTTFDGDYNSLTNKPTIPVVPTNVSAFTNDAGYLTQHQSLAGYATETWVQQQGYSTFDGDYNSLSNKPTIPAAQVQADWNEADTSSKAYIANKPTIPAAQVQTDWNANSGMGQILNKPSMTTETWTFTLSDNSTVTKTVWLQPTV